MDPQYMIGAVLTIMWFARLEHRVKVSEDDRKVLWKKMDSMELKHDALDEKLMNKLTEFGQSLARIEGRLSNRRLGE